MSGLEGTRSSESVEGMDLATLEHAALQCGAMLLALRRRGEVKQLEDKLDDIPGAGLVTEGDLKSEGLGKRIIAAESPGETVVGEESWSKDDPIPPNCTVFDPLDATMEYREGKSHWSVTLCTFREGQPVMAVTYFPKLGVMYTCVKGSGVVKKKKVGLVPGRNEELEGLLGEGSEVAVVPQIEMTEHVGRLDQREWPAKALVNYFWSDTGLRERLQEAGFMVESVFSSTYDGLKMVEGETAGSVNMGPDKRTLSKIWDCAAFTLFLWELGGKATDREGNPLQWDKVMMDWVWAANSEILEKILEAIKAE